MANKLRIILAVCFTVGMISGASADMRISFEWGPTKKCFDSKTPPMQLSGVPQGTANLDIRMQDQNASDFNHGGGKIAYTGENTLPYGAVSYRGPCPPAGQHTYMFTVKALDANGKTLATAKAKRKFPQ
ncbi:phospholipid-binding protein [Phyllobacterium endophyticum]|uniref:Phospholipid-binding protein n=1 Tax=Phyllobacterium endophyticum TaxID=1149773 RepID=A0A2P7AKU2_9HYPH|nr:phospholipid-binding protein [Phyllobacterium endophyticum]MBB3233329.1 hypothetical protein [Phyllobacterium endophyticum]PSH54796.1 phospholipid-binding protein [Phyllobacterium endophyticum]TYR43337.1 phospholipid-binding protein [Phyllobacterium endophyticum]